MNPDTPAQSALKKCFARELSIIRECDNKIISDDAESLHKLRISVRKTRALLAHAQYVLPEKTILKFNREFKFLAQKTCSLRDLDVYLNFLNKYKYSSQDNQVKVQNDLLDYINENKIRETQELLKYLSSVKYIKLKEDWAKILDKPTGKNSRLKCANIPIESVLKKGIIKQYQKMLQQGSKIDKSAPYQKYHDLRKTCKKLRYLLEYFSDLHSKKKIKPLIKALKNTQDILGELQDYRIQIELLNNFMNTKKTGNKYSEALFNSVELFISKLDDKSEDIKSLYPETFNKLSCKFKKRTYKKLFHDYKNIIKY